MILVAAVGMLSSDLPRKVPEKSTTPIQREKSRPSPWYQNQDQMPKMADTKNNAAVPPARNATG